MTPLTDRQRAKMLAYQNKVESDGIFGPREERSWVAMAEGPKIELSN